MVLAASLSSKSAVGVPVKTIDGYWLDQYNAMFYFLTFQLDNEFQAMRRNGASVVMIHADSMPNLLLWWMSNRARSNNLKPVGWVQKPTRENLQRLSRADGIHALQVDDHFFNNPPIQLNKIKGGLKSMELWCSFQPKQYSPIASRYCDHVDLQFYRIKCTEAVDSFMRLSAGSAQKLTIAAYHDGSTADDQHIKCMNERLSQGNAKKIPLFVFKWKNQEHWLRGIKAWLGS